MNWNMDFDKHLMAHEYNGVTFAKRLKQDRAEHWLILTVVMGNCPDTAPDRWHDSFSVRRKRSVFLCIHPG
jgi:hypothetical protein